MDQQNLTATQAAPEEQPANDAPSEPQTQHRITTVEDLLNNVTKATEAKLMEFQTTTLDKRIAEVCDQFANSSDTIAKLADAVAKRLILHNRETIRESAKPAETPKPTDDITSLGDLINF